MLQGIMKNRMYMIWLAVQCGQINVIMFFVLTDLITLQIRDRRDVQFSSQKIKKHKLCGTPGDVDLIFKATTMRYYEMSGQTELLNPLDKKIKDEPLISFYEKEDKFELSESNAPF